MLSSSIGITGRTHDRLIDHLLLRLQTLGQLDVGPIRIGQKSNLQIDTRQLPRRRIHLDALRFQILHFEPNVIQAASLRAHQRRRTPRIRKARTRQPALFKRHLARKTCHSIALPGRCAEHLVVPGLHARNSDAYAPSSRLARSEWLIAPLEVRCQSSEAEAEKGGEVHRLKSIRDRTPGARAASCAW